jgi:HNH endonuclease
MTKLQSKRVLGSRSAIIERDDYTCQDCGVFENLQVHHVDGDRSNGSNKNLITVCLECHRKRHRKLEETHRKLERIISFLENNEPMSVWDFYQIRNATLRMAERTGWEPSEIQEIKQIVLPGVVFI